MTQGNNICPVSNDTLSLCSFMNFSAYQQQSRKTAIYPQRGKNFIYPVLGLVGEAGEIANKVKKIHRDDGGKITHEKREELAGELGDILWYMAQIATEFKLSLDKVATANLTKLLSRKKRGKLRGSGDTR